MSDTFVKLHSAILQSTIWLEDHATVRVWITLLAMADRDGCVQGSVPGLAHTARVELDECQRAIGKFLAPDPHSRTKDHEGRRLAEIDGGWVLLNYQKHRAARDPEKRREQTREAMRRYRQRQAGSQVSHGVSQCEPPLAHAEAEAEAEAEREAENARARGETGGPRATRPWPEVDGEPAGSDSVARALLTEALNLTPPGADELRPGNRRHVAALERLLADGEPPEEVKAILHFAAGKVRDGATESKWWGPRMLEPGPWQRWRDDYARQRGEQDERERRIRERQQELKRAEEQPT